MLHVIKVRSHSNEYHALKQLFLVEKRKTNVCTDVAFRKDIWKVFTVVLIYLKGTNDLLKKIMELKKKMFQSGGQ